MEEKKTKQSNFKSSKTFNFRMSHNGLSLKLKKNAFDILIVSVANVVLEFPEFCYNLNMGFCDIDVFLTISLEL